MKIFNLLLPIFTMLSFTSFANESFHWHGFIAQGLVQNNHSNYIGDDGDISLKQTEIGLNASYTLNNNLRVAGQAVYLNGGNRYTEGVRVDYLFVDWKAINSFDWQVNVHLGRVKNYHWLYSSTRDVPHTRPTIFLPQSVYFDNFRDVALGVDGVAVVANTNSAFGEWEFNWSYGNSPISEQQNKNLLGNLTKGDIEQRYVQQANVVWHKNAWWLGAGVMDSEFEYAQGPADTLVDGQASVQRLILRAVYEARNWQLAAEILRERAIYNNLIFVGFKNDSTSEGGYLQGRYFLNKDITLTARIDIFDLDRKDRDGQIRQLATAGTVPAYFGFQDQFTVGVSWDFIKDWRLQAEVHRVKGAGRLAPVLLPNTTLNDRKYWNIWGVQVTHWF